MQNFPGTYTFKSKVSYSVFSFGQMFEMFCQDQVEHKKFVPKVQVWEGNPLESVFVAIILLSNFLTDEKKESSIWLCQ